MHQALIRCPAVTKTSVRLCVLVQSPWARRQTSFIESHNKNITYGWHMGVCNVFFYILTLSSSKWGRHIHTHPLTPLDCLLWADVEVVCPTESADLIKTEETHHFIWLSLLFGLALIQWLLPALWLCRGVEGGEALCLMLTDSKQNNPPPRVVTSDTPSWVVSGEVSKRIQLPAVVCSSAVD